MTLIQCPECRKNISETAENCPKCGFALAPEMAVALKEKKTKEEARTFLVLGGVTVFFLLLCSGIMSAGSDPPQSDWPEPSTSQKLAAVEVNSMSGASDSALSSAMKRRLESLARKFPETEEQIGDMTAKSQQILREKGVSKSLTQIMDGIDYMIPSGELGVTYAESAAMYVTLESR